MEQIQAEKEDSKLFSSKNKLWPHIYAANIGPKLRFVGPIRVFGASGSGVFSYF